MAGIYVHVPFCRRACPYCDYFFETRSHAPSDFMAALCEEISLRADEYGRREPVRTISFGGGTPSLLTAEEVAIVLRAITDGFDVENVEEISMEANPEDCSPVYVSDLVALGVNRLAIGVQSFFDADLEFLGRSHSGDQAEAAVVAATGSALTSVGVDLLQAIPGQPPEYWAANLERVVRLAVGHVSAYELTIEPGTELGSRTKAGEIVPLGEEDRADQILFTMQYLEDHGFEQYDIAGFARPGHLPAQLRSYWSHENILAFGPSAHSFWRDGLSEAGAYRWSNVRDVAEYVARLRDRKLPVDARFRMSFDRLAQEYIVLRLRTVEGIELERLENEFGIDLLEEKPDELAKLESEGLIATIRNGRLRLTRRGMLVCDSITRRLTA